MKCCCLVVFIFCTIDVSNGGNLSGICFATNGTCGKKGVPCKDTFGSEWTLTGKCCIGRPCCKSFKSQCVPETTCPRDFKLLPNQKRSDNCYSYEGDGKTWLEAQSICARTPGAYLWRPNTEEEANAAYLEYLQQAPYVWTGANDIDKDGIFTFITENGTLNSVPFGQDPLNPSPDEVYVMIQYDKLTKEWIWTTENSFKHSRFICEYQLRVCP